MKNIIALALMTPFMWFCCWVLLNARQNLPDSLTDTPVIINGIASAVFLLALWGAALLLGAI